MSQRLIRVYKNIDIQNIKEHLLIWGDLSATCSNCSGLGLKLDTRQCPQCQTQFQYIAFRNIKDHLPKIVKLILERPEITLVDYEDFKRIKGTLRAENFLPFKKI